MSSTNTVTVVTDIPKKNFIRYRTTSASTSSGDSAAPEDTATQASIRDQRFAVRPRGRADIAVEAAKAVKAYEDIRQKGQESRKIVSEVWSCRALANRAPMNGLPVPGGPWTRLTDCRSPARRELVCASSRLTCFGRSSTSSRLLPLRRSMSSASLTGEIGEMKLQASSSSRPLTRSSRCSGSSTLPCKHLRTGS